MGEMFDFEYGQLFYMTDDGEWKAFDGIKPADIVVCDEMDEETYATLPREGTITCSIINPFTLTEKQKRRICHKIQKASKRMTNKYMRRIRYAKRLKEYARRRALKQARYV